MKALSLMTAHGGTKAPTRFFKPKRLTAFFEPDPAVILRQDGGGKPYMPDAAMENRCGKANGVEHGAAADGQHVGVAIDRMPGEGFEKEGDRAVSFLHASPPANASGAPTSCRPPACAAA